MPRRLRSVPIALAAAAAMTAGAGSTALAATPSAAVSVIQTSADAREALRPLRPLRFTRRRPPRGVRVIAVDDGERDQPFLGVGAALTDASAWLIWDRLAPRQRGALLTDLFAPGGIHLSFLRVPMGASDFTVHGRPYTYDDLPPGQSDPTLSHFSIAHDEAYILPALRAARALNPALYLEAVPWSPPAWMKANDALNDARHRGRLLPAATGPLAGYFVRFLQAYAAAGVEVNAIAMQNEPNVATAYPGMEFPQAEEADFLHSALLPALSAAGLSPAIFGWDLSWGPLSAADPIVQATTSGLSGIAWHCYFGSPHDMTRLHTAAPQAMQILDECSPGAGATMSTSELLITAFRNWAQAAALWNLALDRIGGPVQRPNLGCPGCTGVVTVDAREGRFTPTLAFDELGQVSRYVQPGAVRIASTRYARDVLTPGRQSVVRGALDDVAFLNPDGSKVLVALAVARRPVRLALAWHGRFARTTVPPGSTTTFVWR